MAELSLTARGALDGVPRPGRYRQVGEPGVTLAIQPPCPQAVVVARRGEAETLVATCAMRGLTLPSPGRATLDRDVTVVATGPGQWLAIGESPAPDRVDQLFAPLSALCSLVRVDDARTIFQVAGPAARAALAKMLTIDLHPRTFAPGYAAVTLAGSIPVTLWQRDDAPRYALAVPRSLARSGWHWLTDSAAEYGCAVEGDGGMPAPVLF